jgi:hypothetical protein
MEEQVYDVLFHNGGLMGRESHESQWKKGRRRRVDTFRPDEGRRLTPCTPQKLYETEFGYANLKVAYVQKTSIVPFDERRKRGSGYCS